MKQSITIKPIYSKLGFRLTTVTFSIHWNIIFQEQILEELVSTYEQYDKVILYNDLMRELAKRNLTVFAPMRFMTKGKVLDTTTVQCVPLFKLRLEDRTLVFCMKFDTKIKKGKIVHSPKHQTVFTITVNCSCTMTGVVNAELAEFLITILLKTLFYWKFIEINTLSQQHNDETHHKQSQCRDCETLLTDVVYQINEELICRNCIQKLDLLNYLNDNTIQCYNFSNQEKISIVIDRLLAVNTFGVCLIHNILDYREFLRGEFTFTEKMLRNISQGRGRNTNEIKQLVDKFDIVKPKLDEIQEFIRQTIEEIEQFRELQDDLQDTLNQLYVERQKVMEDIIPMIMKMNEYFPRYVFMKRLCQNVIQNEKNIMVKYDQRILTKPKFQIQTQQIINDFNEFSKKFQTQKCESLVKKLTRWYPKFELTSRGIGNSYLRDVKYFELYVEMMERNIVILDIVM
ncbi:hypothetical protein ABPG72_015443 [Tetrahymena utriculariae]